MSKLSDSTATTQGPFDFLWDHQPTQRKLAKLRESKVGPILVTLYLDSHRLEYWVEVVTEDGVAEQEAFYHEKTANKTFDRIVKELDDIQREPAIMLDLYIENRAAQYQER